MHFKFCSYTKHIIKIDYYVLPTMRAMIFRTKTKMKIKFENAVCILYKRFQILILKLNALLTFQRTDSSKENVTRVMN